MATASVNGQTITLGGNFGHGRDCDHHLW
jgi:hypothetical protein